MNDLKNITMTDQKALLSSCMTLSSLNNSKVKFKEESPYKPETESSAISPALLASLPTDLPANYQYFLYFSNTFCRLTSQNPLKSFEKVFAIYLF